MGPYSLYREPLIWASTGGECEFRVSVELRGRPKQADCIFFEQTMALASEFLRRASAGNRFVGFDGIELRESSQGRG